MDFLPVFIKMVELFAIIILGYVGNKVNVVGPDAKRHLSRIVLNITLPATILSAVFNSTSLPKPSEIGQVLLVACLNYVVFFIVAKVAVWIMRIEGPQKGVAEFAIIFSNVGFIGYPVTTAIFGNESLLYTTIFNMPFNLICYSIGVQIIQSGSKDGKNEAAELVPKKIWRLFLSPALISSVAALIIAMFGWRFPSAIGDTCATVGSITTPAALLIIGSALADMPFKQMFGNAKAYLVTLMSVLVVPLIIYFVFNPFVGDNRLLIGDAVIIAAMPVATAGTMLCVEYGGDEKFMAQVTFLSTLLSVVTIPLIAMIL